MWISLLLLAFVIGLSALNAISRIDYLTYDISQKLSHRAPPSDVVIVAIDESSLSQLGRWPWSRRLHAQVIDHLHAAGAKAIGVDILFSEPDKNDPQADVLLAQSIKNAGNVVLPVVLESTRINGLLVERLPIPSLSRAVNALGRVHAELDEDGIGRSIVLREGIGKATWPHFAESLLVTAGQGPFGTEALVTHEAAPVDGFAVARSSPQYVNFRSGSDSFLTISYAQVLQGNFPADSFRDKLVLLGATAAGLNDHLTTPVSGLRSPMPGVEFLANVVVSMRERSLIQVASPWLTVGFNCILALLPMLWLGRIAVLKGFLACLLYSSAIFVTSLCLPLFLNFWIPLTAGWIGSLSGLTLWTLHNMLSASRFMDTEIQRLGRQLKKFPQQEIFEYESNIFREKILKIRNATNQLLQLQEARLETLAFIAHDIRAPIASVAAQIKQDFGEAHDLHKRLLRVLDFTENFLQISQVEMLDVEMFESLDVIDLLNQVVDEFYPIARERSQVIVVDFPFDPVWIRGHFGSLSRAVGNLLGNAIKFSPENSRIELSAHCVAQFVQIAVTNAGPGIAADMQEKIFEKFRKVSKRNNHSLAGAGLGLYYVKMVVLKHSASLELNSQPGKTSFLLSFPCLQQVAV